ncbi:rubrerythrin family protein [Pradoshia eiseniae]|uniref:Rubrerythrin family protein n=1 Tax=Pradoshia eiseniae TaxID=2064768 RepID=A0A2S7MY97_9BACI|nr:ferritin-like domain-containing protein [Pradoshia eiseniae]PQD94749.1 rubrerythrin family protein [Pradoshia eiseniae]
MYNYYSREQQNAVDQLIKQIKQSIDGEYTAIKCYEKLARMAPNEQERERILEIRKDEIKHFTELVKLYSGIYGREPKPELIEECPDAYELGLEAALIDEQNTVDRYLTIADQSTNTAVKQVFTRAAKDEQQHAVWFLYLWIKNK